MATEIVAMTSAEALELAKCEAVIRQGLKTFVEVGNALMAIRDNRLYRVEHETFEAYCQARWGMVRRQANRLIAAAETVTNLGPIGPIPLTESQVRPMAQLAAEQQQAAWAEAVERSDGKPTAAVVQAVVDEIVGRQKPKTNRAGDIYEPQGFDACQTPAYAIDPLLPFVLPSWVVWEPASGEGSLVDALYDAGRRESSVIATDAITGQNFFEYEPKKWHALITNPPYSIKYQWLERCYALGRPFALLLPVETLGAKRAQALFVEHGVEVMLLDRRVNFKMPNKGWDGAGAQFPVAWFTWGFNLGHQLVFAKLGDES